MNPVSARLLNQQLICQQFTSPHDIVEWMGAMQAQDYKMMRWAVAMRSKRPSAKAFEKDFNEGRIVRVHLFRTTWQLIAGEDYNWMLELCRKPAMRGLQGWMKSNGVNIPKPEQETVRQIFAEVLLRRKSALKSDFAAALTEHGIEMTDQRLSYHIRLAEYSGQLCSGNLHPLKISYALVSDKLPETKQITREEALGMLARKYFRSHGPATLTDFSWWSGLGLNECKQGMEAIADELNVERWKGLNLHSHKDGRTRGFRSGTVHLLPSYDEYLIGYKSRHIALNPDHSHRAHNNTGNFWPVIMQDGQVVGNWSSAGGKIKKDIFHTEVSIDEDALTKECGRYLKFIGK
ncbi:MAG: AlkZ family DNA glycosylase [Bacteroidales bacterium]|nr:AlkZ family DNA glycosylase [Bacteroidales bacterium]